MQIVVVRHSIRNRGGDRLVLDYLSHLSSKGHIITYWTNELDTYFPINHKITIKKIPIPGRLGTILFTLFTKFKEQVIIVDLVVMALLAAVQNRPKVLFLAQDFDGSYYRSNLLKKIIAWAYHQVLNVKRINTIAVSQGLADQLIVYQPKSLIVIPNGVNTLFFKQSIISDREDNSIKSILFFARDDFRKGLDIAILTFSKLKEIRVKDDWEILLIGSATIKNQDLPIRNLGFKKTDQDLREVLCQSDIYFVASRSEGLSLLLLQALSCECAIVSTEASRILTHENTGLISHVNDAENLAINLNRVLTDDNLRNRLRKNARLLAEEYSLEKSCINFEKTLRELYDKTV